MKKKNLLYVGGSKGGTGKSMVCMALVDYFRKRAPKEEILLIETDTSNADVGRLYNGKERISVKGLVLGEDERDWFALLDTIDDTDAPYIIINSMAASSCGIRSQGMLLDRNIEENKLQVNFRVFWVMNRNKDSVTLLRDFMLCMKSPAVFPILNLYFGKEEEFLFYHQDRDVHDSVAKRGGCRFMFPSLNELIADKLYSDEISLEELPQYLKLGMRTGLERWLVSVKEIFDMVFPVA
jgi:hypothetical protein